MKKVFFGFAIGIGIGIGSVALFANKNLANKEVSNGPRDTTIDCSKLVSAELVDSAKAKKWMASYDAFRLSLKADSMHIARSFILETEDLLMALGIPKPQRGSLRHVRVYFGIDSLGNPKTMLVGVDGANLKIRPVNVGKDVYFKCRKNFDDESDFLDLNYPCPTACPIDKK